MAAVAICVAYVAYWLITAPGIPSFSWRDFEIPLPNGYALVQTSTEQVCLADSGKSDLLTGDSGYDWTVDGYRVYTGVVVGYAVNARPAEIEGPPNASQYFFLDYETGQLVTGLSHQDWIKQLRKYGIRSEPVLHRPSGLDAFEGYNRPVRP